MQIVDDVFTGLRPDDPGLHVGVALPVAPMLQQVGLECTETDYGWATIPERAQPGVDSKHETVGRSFVQQCDYLPREAAKVFLRADALRPIRFATLRVEKDDVDV